LGMSEEECIDAFFLAHEVIKKQVQWQKHIAQDYGVEKAPIKETFDWSLWKQRVEASVTPERVKPLFNADKLVRAEVQRKLKESLLEECRAQSSDKDLPIALLEYLFDTVLADVVSELCFTLGCRVDTRPFEKVREVTAEVGVLPSVHGSSLFKRGRTQALVIVTLGGGQDAAKVDQLMGETVEKTFMLHYNFPPFSVGEVKPLRGPGRREIGHGYLAASAVEGMLPSQESFPYTIRIVADILESDGSSSMATVCGSIMALMDAGVPIKHMVSGVAMGLLRSEKGEFQVLTDIAGIEDAYGLMDFKVAGNSHGITAIQMDIKYKGGLERTTFEKALAAALRGRSHILSEMQKVMQQPRPTLSKLVPQVIAFKVSTDKIGAIIGTGGKVIREITEKTGTSIDIADDGLVKIFGQPGEKLDQAIAWVKALGGVIERGARYQGTVKRIAEFGLFVEVAPGLDGLVHISTIPRAEQQTFMKSIKPGTSLKVEVLDFDQASGKIRLMIVR